MLAGYGLWGLVRRRSGSMAFLAVLPTFLEPSLALWPAGKVLPAPLLCSLATGSCWGERDFFQAALLPLEWKARAGQLPGHALSRLELGKREVSQACSQKGVPSAAAQLLWGPGEERKS